MTRESSATLIPATDVLLNSSATSPVAKTSDWASN